MSAKTFLKIQSLHLYPIKSTGGISVNEVTFDAWGLQHDREFMLVDREGRFQTRRESPRMAEIETLFQGADLVVRFSGSEYRVPLKADPEARTEKVRVWKSEVEADHVDVPGLNSDLSKFLGREVHLVRYGRHSHREVVKSGQHWGRQFRFADSANVLITTTESLVDLNLRLKDPITMMRFRPNVVVHGDVPWGEDRWQTLRASSGLELTVVGGCGRCQIITQDVATGVVVSKEPLIELAKFRRFGSSVDFGVHAVHTLPGGDIHAEVGHGPAKISVGEDLALQFKS